ncbi:uncharacterized protein E5676_scaffold148G00430 [Cucumis melo var. makuwa]|nr:uncharacterized protein E5676_scaffold148G00430 [Cucumis melo var. makuwa]
MLHKYVECYDDDLVVKSKRRQDHLKNLKVVFYCLRKYQLRMNPLKCAFGVTSEKFLGFIVRHREIEIDQSKIDAIQKMPRPNSLDDLRNLHGRLAYIQRFISNLVGRCQPFQKLMRKGENFVWDEPCQNAFDSIKKYLLNPSVLRAPIPSKPLILYILHRKGLHSSSSSKGDKAIKGQALTDFLADHPIPSSWKLCDDLSNNEVFFTEVMEPWTMYFDGVVRRSGAEADIVLISPEKHMLPYSFTLAKLCLNNVAEYQALIIDL